jgi:hypothetical protein
MKFTAKKSRGLEVKFFNQDHDKPAFTEEKGYDKNLAPFPQAKAKNTKK